MQNCHTVIAAGTYDPDRPECIQAFVPQEGEHFSLPVKVSKAAAVSAGVEALKIMGGTATDVLVFRQIADVTERGAWHSRECAPVNFQRQTDLARKAGIGERQFRNVERRLECFGLLARTTADNGYRGRRAGQRPGTPVSCGLSLEPVIANYAAITRILGEAKFQEEQRQERVLFIRTAKHRIRKLIDAIADMETRSWAANAYEEMKRKCPKGTLRSLDADTLETIYVDLMELEERIREAMKPIAESSPVSPAPPETATGSMPVENLVDKSVDKSTAAADLTSVPMDNSANQQSISSAPEMNYRSHIQPGANFKESCNEQGPSESPPTNAGEGFVKCSEKKEGRVSRWINPKILENLTEEKLKDLMSEDAALYFDNFQDWRDALPYLLRDLGVNTSTWLDAVEVMGEQIALIALLVIDRNRFHPVSPVKSPGAVLRTFTRRAVTGDLNLTHAIIAIWERDRQGKQPKKEPHDMRGQ